jgi:hypothetical protein
LNLFTVQLSTAHYRFQCRFGGKTFLLRYVFHMLVEHAAVPGIENLGEYIALILTDHIRLNTRVQWHSSIEMVDSETK